MNPTPVGTPATPRIDPLAPALPGRYADPLITVLRADPADPGPAPIVRTAHFTLGKRGSRIELRHRLRPDQIDNDLTGLLADELFAPGWLAGSDMFEHAFTGLIRSTVDDPLLSWLRFYDNTISRIHQCWRDPGAANVEHSTIAGFAPVYRHAMRLTPPGLVLDLGSCFGFFALLLTERTRNAAIASDISTGSMRLLDAVVRGRRLGLETLVCDAAHVPLPDDSVETVTMLHLLEHLDAATGSAVVREASRLARGRVVIAVPFEDEPTDAYGHVRGFDMAALVELGRQSGRRFTVHEHHGGWLVLHRR